MKIIQTAFDQTRKDVFEGLSIYFSKQYGATDVSELPQQFSQELAFSATDGDTSMGQIYGHIDNVNLSAVIEGLYVNPNAGAAKSAKSSSTPLKRPFNRKAVSSVSLTQPRPVHPNSTKNRATS